MRQGFIEATAWDLNNSYQQRGSQSRNFSPCRSERTAVSRRIPKSLNTRRISVKTRPARGLDRLDPDFDVHGPAQVLPRQWRSRTFEGRERNAPAKFSPFAPSWRIPVRVSRGAWLTGPAFDIGGGCRHLGRGKYQETPQRDFPTQFPCPRELTRKRSTPCMNWLGQGQESLELVSPDNGVAAGGSRRSWRRLTCAGL